MSKEIYISSTPHETRLAITEGDELTEIYYERENEYTLAGSIYNGKVTRVLPGMQSAFVDVGLERDAFLYITDFLEEAADSADFDSAEGRRDDGRGRGEGRRRESDGGRTAPDSGYVDVETAAATGEDAGAGLAPAGTQERGGRDRGDRGGRSGDRGRRRRGGSGRERAGSGERPASGYAEQPAYGADAGSGFTGSLADESLATPPFPDPDEMRLGAGTVNLGGDLSGGAEEELGEGTPGTEGSRRWRGRRGRRRGRGTGEGAGAGTADESLVQAAGATDPSVYDLAGPAEDPFGGSSFDVEAAAATTDRFADEGRESVSAQSATAASLPGEQRGSGRRSEAGETAGRSDRGRRDRGEGRESRGDRDERRGGGREVRAPRGFAPRHNLYLNSEPASSYGQEAEATNEVASSEPSDLLILPGESIARLRTGSEAPSAGEARQPAPTAQPTPAPKADYALPGSWDGGAVLPGETIRPRTPRADGDGEADVSRDRGSDRGGERGGERGGGRGRESRGRGGRDDRRGGGGGRRDGGRDRRPATGASHGPTDDTQRFTLRPDSRSSARNEVTGEAEYEPTDASASLRFDPVPPSSFRKSSASDGEAEQPEGTSLTHTITPGPGEAMHPIETASGEPAEATGTHEITTINAEGEMLSPEPALPVASEPESSQTEPIAQETAILEHGAISEHRAETPAVLNEQGGVPADDWHDEGRSPSAASEGVEATETVEADHGGGMEDAEEEEPEDFRTTLNAASIEEMDYDEEETLEGAADLGTMLEEMTIDEVTRHAEEPESDDEFAFEEEDSLDDPIYARPVQESEFAEAGEMDDEAAAGGEQQAAPSAEDRGQRSRSGGRDRRGRGRGGDRERSAEPGREVMRSGERSGRDDRGGREDRGSREERGGREGRSSSEGYRPGRREGHRSAQVTNLPAISDLLKPGQEVLVQIAKEPIAKKGARITSHIALPGRFLVFMPTVSHTGVSRKIESDGERRRLKEILLSEKGDASGGFIVRTAAAGATEEELRNDLRFLLNLWADIKQRSESSKSPALIYHDLNLVERILRDQVTDNFSAIWVDTETEYERVLRFLHRFQPSLIRRVKLYTKETPLFEQFGITEEINKALRSKVWLKSGGSIVINQTEALVAIDINTGKYVGKTARLEDTIVKTNLDAIPEIVRQIRLRDLGGIIIIDFIDMDERKNRHRVMAALEEELKKDRAPSKVLQFNDFGLVAITRKRVKQSLERTLSTPCTTCTGTGMVKSPITVCNDIYVEMRKMQKHLDRGDVMLRVNPEVVKQLKAPQARWLQEMEELVGKTILVKSDPALHPEQFDIH